jgi:hypothetical protein
MTNALVMPASIALDAEICRSTEETRYYLRGFTVEQSEEGGALIVSTDGHKLGCWHISNDAGADKGPRVIVPDEMHTKIISLNAAMLKACKPGRDGNFTRFLIVTPDGHARIVIEADAAAALAETAFECAQTGALIDGTFPDWRRAVVRPPEDRAPKEGEMISAGVMCANASYVATFGKISPAKAGHGIVEIYAGETPGDPMLVKVQSRDDFVGVLMPFRLGANIIGATIPFSLAHVTPKADADAA